MAVALEVNGQSWFEGNTRPSYSAFAASVQKSQNRHSWATLPDQVLSNIINYLDEASIAQVHMVCRSFCTSIRNHVTQLQPHQPQLQKIAKNFPNLKELLLNRSYTILCEVSFDNLRQLKYLSKLEIDFEQVIGFASYTGEISLTFLSSLPTLAHLHLSNAILSKLGTFKSMPALEHITLEDIRIQPPDKSYQVLTDLESCTRLQTLHLAVQMLYPFNLHDPLNINESVAMEPGLEPLGLKALSKMPQLLALSLPSWRLDEARAADTLVSLGALTMLTSLRLDAGSLRAVNWSTESQLNPLRITPTLLSHLSPLTALQSLQLRGLQRDPELLAMACDTFRNLTALKFSLPRNSPRLGLGVLAGMLRLQRLEISGNSVPEGIEDGGWRELDSSVPDLQSLQVKWHCSRMEDYENFASWRTWFANSSHIATTLSELRVDVVYEKPINDQPTEWQDRLYGEWHVLPEGAKARVVGISVQFGWIANVLRLLKVYVPASLPNLETFMFRNEQVAAAKHEVALAQLLFGQFRYPALQNLSINGQMNFPLDSSLSIPSLNSLTLFYLRRPLSVSFEESKFSFEMSSKRSAPNVDTTIVKQLSKDRAMARAGSSQDSINSDQKPARGAPATFNARDSAAQKKPRALAPVSVSGSQPSLPTTSTQVASKQLPPYVSGHQQSSSSGSLQQQQQQQQQLNPCKRENEGHVSRTQVHNTSNKKPLAAPILPHNSLKFPTFGGPLDRATVRPVKYATGISSQNPPTNPAKPATVNTQPPKIDPNPPAMAGLPGLVMPVFKGAVDRQPVQPALQSTQRVQRGFKSVYKASGGKLTRQKSLKSLKSLGSGGSWMDGGYVTDGEYESDSESEEPQKLARVVSKQVSLEPSPAGIAGATALELPTFLGKPTPTSSSAGATGSTFTSTIMSTTPPPNLKVDSYTSTLSPPAASGPAVPRFGLPSWAAGQNETQWQQQVQQSRPNSSRKRRASVSELTMNVETALLSGYEQDSDGEAIGSSEDGAERSEVRQVQRVQLTAREVGEGGERAVQKVGDGRFPEVAQSSRGDEGGGKQFPGSYQSNASLSVQPASSSAASIVSSATNTNNNGALSAVNQQQGGKLGGSSAAATQSSSSVQSKLQQLSYSSSSTSSGPKMVAQSCKTTSNAPQPAQMSAVPLAKDAPRPLVVQKQSKIEVSLSKSGPEFTLYPHPGLTPVFFAFQSLKILVLRECMLSETMLRDIGQISSLEELLLEPADGCITDTGLQNLSTLSCLRSFALEIGRYGDETSERSALGMQKLCRLSSFEYIMNWCQGMKSLREVTLGAWMNKLVKRREFLTWWDVVDSEREVVDRIVRTLRLRRASKWGAVKVFAKGLKAKAKDFVK